MKEQPAVPDLLQLIMVLATDADACEAEVTRTGSSLAKRNFVRALFAWIEAISYLMRRVVWEKLSKQPLTPESIPKLLAASERAYSVDGQGEVVETKLMTRTSNNLAFSLRSFANVVGLSLTINKGNRNWQSYSEALKIRDRITHPKRLEDLELTDADIEAVREAKGMIIGYLKIFHSPSFVSYLKEKANEAKDKSIQMTFTLTEEDLKRFGIE
jgi:hypothetical protein